MRSINPSWKFFAILLPTIMLALFYRPFLNLSVFAVCIFLICISRAHVKTLFIVLIPVTISAIGMFIMGYYYPSEIAQIQHHQFLSSPGIYNGLQLASRVLAFAGLGLLFVLTTDKMDFIKSLEQQCKLPAKFAYGILAAWGILPNMRQEYSKTRVAFYARGITPLPFSPKLLIPLLVKSVRWSESLAAAMESKGFGETPQRTCYHVLKVRARDVVFFLLCCTLMISGIIFFQ